MTIIEIIGILAGSTVMSSIIIAVMERGKKKAEATDILTRVAMNMIAPLEAENERIKKRMTEMGTCIDALEASGNEKDKRIVELESNERAKDRRILELEQEVEKLKRKIVVLEESR